MHAIGYLLFVPEAPPDSPSSREARQAEISSFCEREGHTLATVFADSSNAATDGRPGLRQVFQHLQEQFGEFLVVVTDPAHLGPTPDEAVKAVISVDRLRSRVVCTTENLPDPIQGLLRILTTTGRGAARRQSIRKAMEAKALRGESMGKPPYGYRVGKDGKLEKVTPEAELVRLMFRLYLEEGMGIRTIASYINQAGYHTRRGRNWSIVTIRDILRNRAYTGTYYRFGLLVPQNHPPLVLSETFRRVQDLMHSRSPRRHGGDVQPFLLSGLAYCALCGNRMIGVTRRQTWKREDGSRMRGVYRYYQCQTRANQGTCRYHTWRAANLEMDVEAQLRHQLKGHHDLPADQQMTAQHPPNVRGDKPSYNRRRYLKYLTQTASGAISLRRLGVLLDQLAATTSEREPGEESDHTTPDTDDSPGVQSILDPSRWKGLDHQTRRQLMERWIERIEVGDGEARVQIRQSFAA